MKSCFVFTLIFLLPFLCFCSDSTSIKKFGITGCWVNFGSGINTLGNPGFGGGLNLNFLVSNKCALTLGFIQNEGDLLGGDESIKDFSLLGGLVLSKSKKIIMIASGGLSRVEIKRHSFTNYYSSPSNSGFGLPIHGKLIYSPVPFVNLGINAFLNINKIKPVTGALITVGFGYINQEKK